MNPQMAVSKAALFQSRRRVTKTSQWKRDDQRKVDGILLIEANFAVLPFPVLIFA